MKACVSRKITSLENTFGIRPNLREIMMIQAKVKISSKLESSIVLYVVLSLHLKNYVIFYDVKI